MRTTVEPETKEATQPRQESRDFVAPNVNIFETSEGYCLEAEMPGVPKDGLDISLEGNELTIVGHRRHEKANGQPVFCECQEFDFRRSFELDPAIDAAKISAKMDQGILTLQLPKSERVKPRKISVD
ncbi:MAG TPA: Hsp20/alpha crystallin family protein [Verrucomicrobiae bacterium]|nr:Hsp20/alpha crystallin family protein [Verrucomicrobiae bacterium]